MKLQQILDRPDIWRAGELAHAPCSPTGIAALDALIGGWPLGALTEILLPAHGIGELRLFAPLLVREEAGWIVFMAPPYMPYAPALGALPVNLARVLVVQPPSPADRLWATEIVLRDGGGGIVFAWPGAVVQSLWLRRLQLAAEAGAGMGILFRPVAAASENSPAALRLKLEPAKGGLRLQVLKKRGGSMGPINGIRLD
jgi:cell division inhibitor SulA/protein ImuA